MTSPRGTFPLRVPTWRPRIAADPLIKEARERQRRRRGWFILALLFIATALAIYGGFGPGKNGGAGGTPARISASQPAEMPRADGWHVGSARVATPGCAHCVQTASWASTIPYRDKPNDFPVRTMHALGPHDAILQVIRAWEPSPPAWALKRHPLRIAAPAIHSGFEGNPTRGRVAEWGADSWRGGSTVEVYAFFGSPHPSKLDIARVQRELALTKFPLWRIRK